MKEPGHIVVVYYKSDIDEDYETIGLKRLRPSARGLARFPKPIYIGRWWRIIAIDAVEFLKLRNYKELIKAKTISKDLLASQIN